MEREVTYDRRREMGIRTGRRRVDAAVMGREISGCETRSSAGSPARPDGQAQGHGPLPGQAAPRPPGASRGRSERFQAGGA